MKTHGNIFLLNAKRVGKALGVCWYPLKSNRNTHYFQTDGFVKEIDIQLVGSCPDHFLLINTIDN